MQDSILVKEVRSLYQNYKLQECIAKVEELDQSLSFNSHQLLQLYRGLSYFELGQVNQGIQIFQQLLVEQKQEKDVLIDAIDLIVRINYCIQVYYYNEYLCRKIAPDLKEVYEKFKELNILCGNKDEFQKGVQLYGYGTYLIINRDQDKLEEALQALQESSNLLEDFKQDVLSFLGFSYYYSDKQQQCLKFSLQLYQLNPQYPSISNNVALCYSQLMDFDQAEKYFQEAENLCPNNNFIMSNQAKYYESRKNKEKAKWYYQKCYDVMPRQARACCAYGKFLCKQKEYEEGILKFQEGLDLDPQYINNYIELAYHLASSDIELSKNLILKSIELQPENEQIYMTLGEIQKANNQYLNAIHSYFVCLQLSKNDTYIQYKAHSMLGRCFLEENLYQNSLKHFFKASNYVYKNYDNYNISQVCKIIDESEIELQIYALYLIEQQEQGAVTKFNNFANQVKTLNFKILFYDRLDNLRQVLQLITYQKHVQQYLIYRNEYSHLDFYFD
ncbi:tetratricopeptide repeat protein (macronuclear) [Tetrahymena thermophila SB210]|uniref:Tetratricopeptide repeat protein n=1 Tax=Tetrahymena thermophila (strain SB210) TaxID=312017 RepID=I7MK46_TETTS|nr:tetratricopeptide repeat protein [Tetrahymena thermophila SB210]EAR97526.1 tetratricopeptide repeat protein [Tetrahymena thermophila SB210]|eukprot:XP_001017771.1 tetratricopeptide repeat protein [Tetrahymena thermophila SB210]